MTISTLDEPSEAIDSPALLVNIEALLRLKQLGDRSATSLIVLEVEVAHQVMRVEVEFFEAEWGRHLTFIIYVRGIE